MEKSMTKTCETCRWLGEKHDILPHNYCNLVTDEMTNSAVVECDERPFSFTALLVKPKDFGCSKHEPKKEKMK